MKKMMIKVKATLTLCLENLLLSGVTVGYKTKHWDPSMAIYLYGSRNNIDYINLDLTIMGFRRFFFYLTACIKYRKKLLVFVHDWYVIKNYTNKHKFCIFLYNPYAGWLTNYKINTLKKRNIFPAICCITNGEIFKNFKNEAKSLNIPTGLIIDSNKPAYGECVIPGNDVSELALDYYAFVSLQMVRVITNITDINYIKKKCIY